MSISACSAALRGHVDAAFDPTYEQLFAALDLLLVLRTQHRPDSTRVQELREVLEAGLAELDRSDRPEPVEAPRTGCAAVPARESRRWSP